MAYATISHVKARNPQRVYTATSKPSVDDVTSFLEQTAGILDGILTGRGFQLPVPTAATSALALLEHYNALGAWAEVERAAPGGKSPNADPADKLWADAQKMLRDGLVEPVGLVRDVTRTSPRG